MYINWIYGLEKHSQHARSSYFSTQHIHLFPTEKNRQCFIKLHTLFHILITSTYIMYIFTEKAVGRSLAITENRQITSIIQYSASAPPSQKPITHSSSLLYTLLNKQCTNVSIFCPHRVNVGCGPAEERVLLTGLHAVADIYCECCKTTLGWKYVRAFYTSLYYDRTSGETR